MLRKTLFALFSLLFGVCLALAGTPPILHAQTEPTSEPPRGKGGGTGEIAYINYGAFHNVFTINVETGESRQVTDYATDISPVSWSPRGDFMVWSAAVGGDADLFIMSADGQQTERITSSSAEDFDPAWSPDGTRIAFVSDRADGAGDIFIMDVDISTGDAAVRLTNSDLLETAPVWSPDGTQIIYLTAITPSNYDLYIMNADGTEAHSLTTSERSEYAPAWSPDGTRIAFHAFEGNFEIYVLDLVTGEEINLTNNDVADYMPAWSPDGQYIAFTSLRVGNAEIFIMDADGANPVQITSSEATELGAAWRP